MVRRDGGKDKRQMEGDWVDSVDPDWDAPSNNESLSSSINAETQIHDICNSFGPPRISWDNNLQLFKHKRLLCHKVWNFLLIDSYMY